jgi:sporulation protein Cse60
MNYKKKSHAVFIFTSKTARDLEAQLNKYLAETEGAYIDIKYAINIGEESRWYTAILVMEFEEEEE